MNYSLPSASDCEKIKNNLDEIKINFKNNSKEYILITGATGYLGNHLVDLFIKNNPDQKLLVLTRSSALKTISDQIEYIIADIGSDNIFTDLISNTKIKKVKLIYHLGAIVKHDNRIENWIQSIKINIDGTICMYYLAYLNDCPLINVSTSGTIAFHHLNPSIINTWPYYYTKIQAEKALEIHQPYLEVNLITVRPSMMLGSIVNIFGTTNIYERNIVNKVKHNPILFNSDGIINFVDVRFVARILYKFHIRFPSKSEFNLMGPNMNLGIFFKIVAEIHGLTRFYLPFFIITFLCWIGILIKPVEYQMVQSQWYWTDPRFDEYKICCHEEMEFVNCDYESEYPVEYTLDM